MIAKLFLRSCRFVLPSARSLRMAAYSTFAFGLLAGAGSRAVYADAREMGLGVGHQLAKLEDLTAGAYRIQVNGADLHRASAFTAQSTSEVLDRYEAYCQESPGAIGKAMNDIPSALEARVGLPHDVASRAHLVREEKQGRGMVVCFVDDASTPARPFVERMRALETGDLSALGHFRYVFAEPSTREGGGTHVVTFWSDGELNVQKMFPASGDAPGTDSAIVPRPAGSRRTLSASVEGYPASVRIYESLASRESITAMYAQALRAKGFVEAATTSARSGSAWIHDDGAEVILSITADGPRTIITVVEAQAAPTAGVRAEVRK